MTGMGSDYSLSSSDAMGRPGVPDDIMVTFHVDSIAQEIIETAKLMFTPTNPQFPPGAIIQDTIEFVITDSDGKMSLVCDSIK